MKISAFGHCWVLRWPWVLAVLAVAAVPAGLSAWQWQRGEDKLATLARIAQWEREGAVGLARLAELAAAPGRAAMGARSRDIDAASVGATSVGVMNDSASARARRAVVDGVQLDFEARWNGHGAFSG